MSLLRAAARPMLASIFIIQGYDTLRHPERVASAAEPVVQPLAKRVSVIPEQAEQAVRINGAVQLAAGSLLAMGRFPRLSALAIAATLVPTTAAGHRFWETEDKQDRAQQRIHFLKNMSMFGGLLIAAGDTAGKPSLAWRTRYAARYAERQVPMAAKAARGAGSAAAAKASAKAAKSATKAARKAAKAPSQASAGRFRQRHQSS